MFSTKQVGDIAEYRVIAELLARGANVLIPVGDRLPYDLGIDIDGVLIKIQVKSAFNSRSYYTVNTRRIQTNRKISIYSSYKPEDFNFAIIYHPLTADYYIIPSHIFISYRSAITIGSKRGRVEEFKNKWDLLFS